MLLDISSCGICEPKVAVWAKHSNPWLSRPRLLEMEVADGKKSNGGTLEGTRGSGLLDLLPRIKEVTDKVHVILAHCESARDLVVPLDRQS